MRDINQYRTRAASGEDSSIFITSAGPGKTRPALFLSISRIGTNTYRFHMTYSFFRNFSGARFWFGISLAGILTQLEMSQKPLKVVRRTPGRTPLGIFCWLEVIDFDLFLGFLFLARHVG
jgi:hypothetical protein